MAEVHTTSSVPKASWDETNIGIFLQCLVDEIDAGNRPGGQFTKQAWATITSKFQSLSGCKFNQSQLKNKWNNLKKDFSLWEKLLHEESGLGYDYTTGRVIADPAWWRNKIQERPELKRFRTHGPCHLDLQERVFRGQVATGYMEYIPTTDVDTQQPVLNEIGDDIPTIGEQVPASGIANEDSADRTTIPTPSSGTQARRKRSWSSSKNPTGGDVNASMIQLIHKWREQAESSASVHVRRPDRELSYADSLKLLTSLSWLDQSGQDYMDALVLLEDPNKRVALCHLIDMGEEFVKRWIRTLQAEKNRRLFSS